jgi:dihydroneopterin aldolase
MAQIEIKDMEFNSFHGCFAEERIIGNRFLVNLVMQTDTSKAELTDDIADTLNYQHAYLVIKEQMEIKSHLLEHIANRILTALFDKFPMLDYAMVEVAKMNPPLGGQMKSVNVRLERSRK